jgi:hypothetical protein
MRGGASLFWDEVHSRYGIYPFRLVVPVDKSSFYSYQEQYIFCTLLCMSQVDPLHMILVISSALHVTPEGRSRDRISEATLQTRLCYAYDARPGSFGSLLHHINRTNVISKTVHRVYF